MFITAKIVIFSYILFFFPAFSFSYDIFLSFAHSFDNHTLYI